MRKVIQITEGGVHLCNDGTMWKKLCLASDDDGEPSVKWLELDNVPQPEANIEKPKGPSNQPIETPMFGFLPSWALDQRKIKHSPESADMSVTYRPGWLRDTKKINESIDSLHYEVAKLRGADTDNGSVFKNASRGLFDESQNSPERQEEFKRISDKVKSEVEKTILSGGKYPMDKAVGSVVRSAVNSATRHHLLALGVFGDLFKDGAEYKITFNVSDESPKAAIGVYDKDLECFFLDGNESVGVDIECVIDWEEVER